MLDALILKTILKAILKTHEAAQSRLGAVLIPMFNFFKLIKSRFLIFEGAQKSAKSFKNLALHRF